MARLNCGANSLHRARDAIHLKVIDGKQFQQRFAILRVIEF